MATAKMMQLPFLTQIPGAVGHVGGIGVVSFLLGEVLGGSSGGVTGAAVGVIVAVLGQLVWLVVQLRKQKLEFQRQATDTVITIDKERDAIVDRANAVHAQQIEGLTRQNERDKEFLRSQLTWEKDHNARETKFLQDQVSFHSQMELAVRQRLHEMVNEVQRCVTYITLADKTLRENQIAPPMDFEIKSFKDIVAMYPLPEAPKSP